MKFKRPEVESSRRGFSAHVNGTQLRHKPLHNLSRSFLGSLANVSKRPQVQANLLSVAFAEGFSQQNAQKAHDHGHMQQQESA
ncbi:MAG: hypothetical protein OHK0023_22920 [Anaerolineae bacterium]